jgi:putative ABC transport system permease protein
MSRARAVRNLFAPSGIPLAWRQLAADKKRLATAVAGVTFGVMLMLFQLGLYNAIDTMVILPQMNMAGDLVMTSTDFEYIGANREFTRRRLYQAASLDEVSSVAPVYVGFLFWSNPETHRSKQLLVMAVEPDHDPFINPVIRNQIPLLQDPEAVLFDSLSQSTFGPVTQLFRSGPVETELERRHCVVRGLFEIGPTLAASANVIMSDEGYFRYRPYRARNMPNLGFISLKKGADPERTAARLHSILPNDVRVITRDRFMREEQTYWNNRTPVGFVVTAGMIVGMLVGAIVVYQILYTDVNDHLKEYATLKAIGIRDLFFTVLVLEEALILVCLSFPPAFVLTLGIDRLARERVNIPARIETGQALMVLLAVAVMCLLAGQLATRRLRSADPANVF